MPEDPYLLYSTDVRSSVNRRQDGAGSGRARGGRHRRAADGLDIVGIYAAGTICRGFANSFGQRNWHEVDNFNFDWSLYHRGRQGGEVGVRGIRMERRRRSMRGCEPRACNSSI